MLKFVIERVENIVGKGENAGFSAFSPFPTMFSECRFTRVVNLQTAVKATNLIQRNSLHMGIPKF